MPRGLTPRERQNERYWTEFCDYLRQRGIQFQSRTSKKRHFINFRIGISRCSLRVNQVIESKYGPIAIAVGFIMERNAMTYFDLLQEQQAEIEEEFGKPLEWSAHRKSEKHVGLRRKDLDPSDENDWPRQHEWMATKLEKIK